MDTPQELFEQLGEEDRKAAIDVAVATVLIGLRIPSTGKPLYDWITTEFASCSGLPPQVVKYSLRHLGQTLHIQDWTLIIEKRGKGVVTKFSRPVSGPDGETQ